MQLLPAYSFQSQKYAKMRILEILYSESSIVGMVASTDKKHPHTLRSGQSGLASGEWGFEVDFIYPFSKKNRLNSRASVMMCWVGHELGGQTKGS